MTSEENMKFNGYDISDENICINVVKYVYKVLKHLSTDRLLHMAHVNYATTLHKSLINSF
jgi:hypothetical protein